MIDEAAHRDPFVILDLEGTKNVDVSVGLGRAGLALIPMQGSRLDTNKAANVVGLIRTQGDVFRRTMPFQVFFIRISPVIESKGVRDIRTESQEFGILPASDLDRGA